VSGVQAGAVPSVHTEAWTFERLAGAAAIVVAVGGLVYSVAFVVYLENEARWSAYVQALALLIGGVLTSAVFVALYERLRAVDAGIALWALLLGLVGALSSAVHGAYDLANLANTPTSSTSDLPNAVDPRGFGTFALTGLAILVASALVLRGGVLPRRLGLLGLLAGALLIWVYIGRLVILDPKSLGVIPFAVVLGLVVNPAWYAWVGLSLMRGRTA
jgi:hypothetical protein